MRQTNVTDFFEWYKETFKSDVLPFGTDYGSLGSLILSIYNHPARKLSFITWIRTTGRDIKIEALRELPDLSSGQIEEVIFGIYEEYLKDLEDSTLWTPVSFDECLKEVKEEF